MKIIKNKLKNDINIRTEKDFPRVLQLTNL